MMASMLQIPQTLVINEDDGKDKPLDHHLKLLKIDGILMTIQQVFNPMDKGGISLSR